MTSHEHSLAGCLVACAAMTVLFVGAAAIAGLIVAKENHPLPPGYIGEPQRGHELVLRYGCTACHAGIGDAPAGDVGPTLEGIARRAYIAGQFPNTRIRMVEWLQHPQALKPGTAMPDLGVNARDARDIAAFLATMK